MFIHMGDLDIMAELFSHERVIKCVAVAIIIWGKKQEM